jgi:hypothetical protein
MTSGQARYEDLLCERVSVGPRRTIGMRSSGLGYASKSGPKGRGTRGRKNRPRRCRITRGCVLRIDGGAPGGKRRVRLGSAGHRRLRSCGDPGARVGLTGKGADRAIPWVSPRSRPCDCRHRAGVDRGCRLDPVPVYRGACRVVVDSELPLPLSLRRPISSSPHVCQPTREGSPTSPAGISRRPSAPSVLSDFSRVR